MSSVNAMNFLSLSRRDDMISLTYLLIYMIQGQLRFTVKNEIPLKCQFNYIKNGKMQQVPEKLCVTPRAKLLVNFVKYVHNLAFEEQPDYQMMRQMLKEASVMSPVEE